MNKNMYILPVSATIRDIKYPDPIIPTKEQLEKKLRGAGLSITITEDLSHNHNHLYAGHIDKKPVIVKHIEQSIPQTPLDFFIMSDGHAVEAKVIKKLHGTEVRVPELIEAVPKLTTNIMSDLRAEKFENFADMIMKKKLPKGSATRIGESLAKLAKLSKSWAEFKTEASSARVYFTHSLEMLISYPQQHEKYEKLRVSFISEAPEDETVETSRGFVWRDSNPQHVMIDKNGDISLYDFSESYFGDQTFMLSSMIAHLMAYSVAGYIKSSETADYLTEMVKAYTSIFKLTSEEAAASYIGMELLHVANGKDIRGVITSKQSLAIQALGRTILDKELTTIKQVLAAFKKA